MERFDRVICILQKVVYLDSAISADVTLRQLPSPGAWDGRGVWGDGDVGKRVGWHIQCPSSAPNRPSKWVEIGSVY